MTDDPPPDVTLQTLHQDLRDLTALIASGLRTFPPEWPGEVIRLLRETNRLNEERFSQLDIALREQSLETHTILRALAEGQRQFLEAQRQVVEAQHHLVEGQRQLSHDIRALIARIDALIKGREDGGSSQAP